MFICALGILRDAKALPWYATIDGCPSSGLAAIDFRRAHGLSDAPTSKIEMPGYCWQDEEFVRQHARLANDNADILSEYTPGRQIDWQVNAINEIYQPQYALYVSNDRGPYVHLAPEVIRVYLAKQDKETGRAVFRDLWFGERRLRARAMHEAFDLGTTEGRTRALAWLKNDHDALAEACAIVDAASEGIAL